MLPSLLLKNHHLISNTYEEIIFKRRIKKDFLKMIYVNVLVNVKSILYWNWKSIYHLGEKLLFTSLVRQSVLIALGEIDVIFSVAIEDRELNFSVIIPMTNEHLFYCFVRLFVGHASNDIKIIFEILLTLILYYKWTSAI